MVAQWKAINQNYKNLDGYKRVAWPPAGEERVVREFTPQPQTQYQPEPAYQQQKPQQQQQPTVQPQQQYSQPEYRAPSYDSYKPPSQQPPQQQQPQQQQQYRNPPTPYQGKYQQPPQPYQQPAWMQAQQPQQPQQPQVQQQQYEQPPWVQPTSQSRPLQAAPQQYQPTPQQYQAVPQQYQAVPQQYQQQQYQAPSYPNNQLNQNQYKNQYQPPQNQFVTQSNQPIYNSYSQPQQQQQQQLTYDSPDHLANVQAAHDVRGSSPGIITLRKETPLNEKPHQVYTSQPAAVSYNGGSNMRGDLKWPPPEYKEAAAVENEERRKLALGPVCRPRKINRDYSSFFAKNALSHHYPSYKVPPGTQHILE